MCLPERVEPSAAQAPAALATSCRQRVTYGGVLWALLFKGLCTKGVWRCQSDVQVHSGQMAETKQH